MGRPNITVMIVEDDHIIALELRKYIQEAGYDVFGPFSSVAQAKKQLDFSLPDHAFLDVNLKDGTVYPIADLLSDHGVPFTFVTAYSGDVRSNGYEEEVLQKPLARKDIRLRLVQLDTANGN